MPFIGRSYVAINRDPRSARPTSISLPLALMTTQQPQLFSDYLPSIGSSGVNMESEDVVEIAFRSVDINESGSVSKTVRNVVTIRPYHIAVQYFLVI